MIRHIASFVLFLLVVNPFTQSWIASRYVVDDGLAQSDAVVALRGGIEEEVQRIEEGVRLVNKGNAPLLVLDLSETSIFGHSESQLAQEYFAKKGMPARQMKLCENHADSTHEEALALRACFERLGLHSVIVVTSEFHTLRARSVLRQVLSGSGITVRVHPSYNPVFWDTHWWRKRRWAKTFFDETVRLVWWQIERSVDWLRHKASDK